MSGAEWTALTVAAIGALGAVLLQIFQMYFSYKRDQNSREQARAVEKKLDHNTVITQAGTTAAVVNAREAAECAANAKVTVDNIDKKLNGGIDTTIGVALAPVIKSLTEHASQDEKNMEDVAIKFKELTDYVHKRNHDVLDALHAQAMKVEIIETILKRLESRS